MGRLVGCYLVVLVWIVFVTLVLARVRGLCFAFVNFVGVLVLCLGLGWVGLRCGC